MHPEVRQENPGRCPKCGMNLVLEGEVKKMPMHEDKGLGEITWKSYMPLIVVISIILLTTITLAYEDASQGAYSLANTIEYFMIGFFLVFAGFKLMDIHGFAEGYSTYDLLAFAVLMILSVQMQAVLWAELVVMLFSGIGVAIKIAKGEKFQCACLGTFLKVPLTYVTLIEDFGMAGLAGILLVLK